MIKHNLNPNYKHLRQTLIEDLEKESNDLHPGGNYEISYGMNNYGQTYPIEPNGSSYGMNNHRQSYPTEPNRSPIPEQTYSGGTESLESFQVNNEPSQCRMCDIYYKQHRHILFIMYIIIAFLCVLCLILINKLIHSKNK